LHYRRQRRGGKIWILSGFLEGFLIGGRGQCPSAGVNSMFLGSNAPGGNRATGNAGIEGEALIFGRNKASQKAIARIMRVWKIFELPTQATAFSQLPHRCGSAPSQTGRRRHFRAVIPHSSQILPPPTARPMRKNRPDGPKIIKEGVCPENSRRRRAIACPFSQIPTLTRGFGDPTRSIR
jgi:hypothetical protein